MHRMRILLPLLLIIAGIFYVVSSFPSNNKLILDPLTPSQIKSPTITQIPTTLPEPVINVGLVGDLGLGRHITSTARAKNDFSWSFNEISPWLTENTFNLANLESPIISSCPEGKTGTFTFCGDERFIPQLSKNKFFLNLNNNHILNYRQQGLVDTQKFLSEANIPNFFDNFLIKEIDGIKLGFLGYDFITYPETGRPVIARSVATRQSVLDEISASKKSVDYLFVSIHWGNEYLPKAEKWRVDLAHQMVDAGADIIHGHHPHVWQDVEKYKESIIFYSFGNFVFDQSWSYETSHSQIAKLRIQKGEPLTYELFPVEIRSNSQPRLMP